MSISKIILDFYNELTKVEKKTGSLTGYFNYNFESEAKFKFLDRYSRMFVSIQATKDLGTTEISSTAITFLDPKDYYTFDFKFGYFNQEELKDLDQFFSNLKDDFCLVIPAPTLNKLAMFKPGVIKVYEYREDFDVPEINYGVGFLKNYEKVLLDYLTSGDIKLTKLIKVK